MGVAGEGIESGVTVIGSFDAGPSYVDFAESTGANYFSVPEDEWASMSEEEQWQLNQKFLDDAIERGDAIKLSSSPLDAEERTGYYKELRYLESKGYQISGDTMVKIVEDNFDVLPFGVGVSYHQGQVIGGASNCE